MADFCCSEMRILRQADITWIWVSSGPHLDIIMLIGSSALIDQIDLVLQNDDVLQPHDFHSRQML